jgi:hypothetical protein
MQFSTTIGENSIRSTNLRLQNPFESIWEKVGKSTHLFNDMPFKFSTTYHMKWKKKDYQYKKTFDPNAIFYFKNMYL